ncbi:ParB-like nuclease family protein [Fusobacterium naviforme]|nr:ParB-like nuclease family protein [Fusobacterium naviforme]STO27705.1 ParB-like nuclease domain [Fusobacterium naviforme]
MKITVKKLSDLKLSDRNIRKHTEKQLSEYVRSVRMFGQIKPIVVDEHGVILAGNGLYAAMQRAGIEECDCYVMKGLSEKQKRKLMLADNRVFELGITDTSVFEEIVKELDGDIDIPGWDEDLLQMLNQSLSEATATLESYGSFTEQEADRINSREREEHVPGSQPPAYESRIIEPNFAENGQISEENAQNPQNVPTDGPNVHVLNEGARTPQTIICPHCGKEICL